MGYKLNNIYFESSMRIYSHGQKLYTITKQLLNKPVTQKIFSATIGYLCKTDLLVSISHDL